MKVFTDPDFPNRPIVDARGKAISKDVLAGCCSFLAEGSHTVGDPTGSPRVGDCYPELGRIYFDVEESAWCNRVAVWCNVRARCVDGVWGYYTANDVALTESNTDFVMRMGKYCEPHKFNDSQCDHASHCKFGGCETCTEGPKPVRIDEFPVVWRCAATDAIVFDFNPTNNLHAINSDGSAAYADALAALAALSGPAGVGRLPHRVYVQTQVYKWRQQSRDTTGDTCDILPAFPHWTTHGVARVGWTSGALIQLCVDYLLPETEPEVSCA